MSRIAQEIRESMFGFAVNGTGEPAAHFRFGENFIGFQGHFPGQKVLPGVCQVQCVQTVLETWKGNTVRLREIVSAKYVLPVLPGDEIACRCLDVKEGTGLTSLRAVITRGDEKISDFRLKVILVPPEPA